MVCVPGVFDGGESVGGGKSEDSVGCGGELDSCVIDDGMANDGVARQWRGERRSSSISSGPRSSSALFRLFLSRLAGGGSATGDEGGGGIGAAATDNDSCGRN